MAKAAKRAPVKAKRGATGKSTSKSKPAKPVSKAKKGGSTSKATSKSKSKPLKKKPAGKKPAVKAKVIRAVPVKISKTSPSPKIEKKVVAVAAKGAKPIGKGVKPAAKTVVPPVKVVGSAKGTAPAKVAALAKASVPSKAAALVVGAKPAVNGKAAKLPKPTKPEKHHRPFRSIPFTPPLINEVRAAAPVPTDSKPRKNQAGFHSRELEHFRDLLLAKRGEIVGDMSAMEREALRTSGGSNLSTLPIHMADIGTDNYEQEFTLGLVETERKLLREINNALAKIQNGAYGICEGTGKPISKARLDVQPWARYSIEFAKQMERMGKGYQI